jgi:hypothetical protein
VHSLRTRNGLSLTAHYVNLGTYSGYPGDGIDGVFGVLNRAGDQMQFVKAAA